MSKLFGIENIKVVFPFSFLNNFMINIFTLIQYILTKMLLYIQGYNNIVCQMTEIV